MICSFVPRSGAITSTCGPINGIISCKVEDAVTGRDITGDILGIKEKNFSLQMKSNSAAGFELKVPAKQLNPLKIIIVAKGTEYADAE